MNHKERFIATINHEASDRTAVFATGTTQIAVRLSKVYEIFITTIKTTSFWGNYV
jgi:dihydrodipicolinate reductase